MYAIVKTGGKQYKVAVGDVVEVEKLTGDANGAVTLPALVTTRQAPACASSFLAAERPWMAAPACRAARARPRT